MSLVYRICRREVLSVAGCETDLLPDRVLRPVRAPKPDSGGKFVLALGEGARTYRCRGVQPQEVPGHWQHRAMGLFGRRKAAQFDTGHAGDDQLLAQLAQMGDLAAPRHWVHYLYFADEAAARGAAVAVEAAGWGLQDVAESAAGGPEWVVIAERHGAVTTPEAVRSARMFFETVAQQWAGGDYDGWEASA